MTPWSLSFNVNACYLTFAEIINAAIFLGMIVYRFEQWNLVAWNEGGMDRGCVGAFTEISQIGFACRFGKFRLRNLTMGEKKHRETKQWNDIWKSKCDKMFHNHHLQECQIFHCFIVFFHTALHFVRKIDGNFRKTISWELLSALFCVMVQRMRLPPLDNHVPPTVLNCVS